MLRLKTQGSCLIPFFSHLPLPVHSYTLGMASKTRILSFEISQLGKFIETKSRRRLSGATEGTGEALRLGVKFSLLDGGDGYKVWGVPTDLNCLFQNDQNGKFCDVHFSTMHTYMLRHTHTHICASMWLLVATSTPPSKVDHGDSLTVASASPAGVSLALCHSCPLQSLQCTGVAPSWPVMNMNMVHCFSKAIEHMHGLGVVLGAWDSPLSKADTCPHPHGADALPMLTDLQWLLVTDDTKSRANSTGSQALHDLATSALSLIHLGCATGAHTQFLKPWGSTCPHVPDMPIFTSCCHSAQGPVQCPSQSTFW
jgi:hypothetical protein